MTGLEALEIMRQEHGDAVVSAETTFFHEGGEVAYSITYFVGFRGPDQFNWRVTEQGATWQEAVDAHRSKTSSYDSQRKKRMTDGRH